MTREREAVCLVIPPSPFLLDERAFVPIGLLRVASALEAAGHPVEVLDLDGIKNYEEAAAAHARTTAAAAVGITATTPQMPSAKRIVAAMRLGGFAGRVVIGGPHATVVCAAAKKERARGEPGRARRALEALLEIADVVVAGDGEEAIFAALRAPRGGVVDADDPGGPLFLTRRRVEELPLPARHLVDMGSYHYEVDGERASSMIAQLGCPYQCAFCSGRSSPMLRRARIRSTASVLRELEAVHREYGYRGMMLYDDELNVNKQVVELMRGIADLGDRLGIEWRLRGFVKAELFDDEQAAAMRRAGFRWLLTGFESGSERILTNINKKATRADNTRCVEVARRHGLKVKALMSIGHAGESEETVEETRRWLLEVAPEDFDVTIITPYPGCPYYDDAVETAPGRWTYSSPRTGDRLHAAEIDYGEVADYYKGCPGDYTSYVSTDRLSAADLVALRDRVEADVRSRLGIPFNRGGVALRYEHSMGQSLPPHILRRSEPGRLAALGGII